MSRCARWLGLLMVTASACGSGGAGAFTPTTPVADVCSMLAQSTVQTLLPGAPAGIPLAPSDDADVWTHGCSWQTGGLAISLLVEGALTSKGNQVLGFEVDATSNATTQATAVSGVGDQAVYLVNTGLGDQILNARKGSHLVSVAAYSFTPAVPEASLQPLVIEALGRL